MEFCILSIIISCIIILIIRSIKYNLRDALLCSGVGLLIISILTTLIFYIDYHMQTDCEEVWSGKITSVRHVEEWTEPGYYETVTHTDSEGNTYTEEEWVPPVHHNAVNFITTSDEGEHRVGKTLDGKQFTDDFVNSDEELKKYYPIGMPTASVHIYENKIQASQNIYKKQDIDMDKYTSLPEYPKTQSNFQINRLIGNYNNKKECIQILNECNSRLNDTNNPNNKNKIKSYKQVNMIFVNMGNVSEDYGYALMNYWKGGNKNDYIIAFGSNNNKVTWCIPITWCESEMLKVNTIDYMKNQSNLNDFKTVIADISNFVEKDFVRKQFADFNYLNVYMSSFSKILIMVFDALTIAFFVFYVKE